MKCKAKIMGNDLIKEIYRHRPREKVTNLSWEMKSEQRLPWKLDVAVRKMGTGFDLDDGHDLQQQNKTVV
jgi:hypothetical protein